MSLSNSNEREEYRRLYWKMHIRKSGETVEDCSVHGSEFYADCPECIETIEAWGGPKGEVLQR